MPVEPGRSRGSLWEFARSRGMGRRNFLRLLAAGGAGAVLVACGVQEGTQAPRSSSAQSAPNASDELPGAILKDPAHFLVHDEGNWEARLDSMQGLITPARYFFVRNNSSSPELDASTWRLIIEGDAVNRPLELGYKDLLQLPAHLLLCYLECAGNHRAMFDLVQGRPAAGTQWRTGAIGNGEWVGASLRDVLTLAGIKDSAASVLLVGLDAESPEGGFQRALPVEKAMHPDTLLAYTMNGETSAQGPRLPGAGPGARLGGQFQHKVLGRIVVSSQQHWTRNNTSSYVLIGDGYPPEGEAEGMVAEMQSIKSALALPWPAELPAGQHRLHGFAHSPHGPIARLEWSLDSGASWEEAELPGPRVQYSWSRFEFAWTAGPGEHVIMTRATDAAGNSQPDRVPFNEKGYLFNQPLPHPLRVS